MPIAFSLLAFKLRIIHCISILYPFVTAYLPLAHSRDRRFSLFLPTISHSFCQNAKNSMLGTHTLPVYFFMLVHTACKCTETDEALFKLSTLLKNPQCVILTKYDSTHLKNKKLSKATAEECFFSELHLYISQRINS